MRSLSVALAALFWMAGAASAQTPPPPACDGAERRAFDFWIGEWDAYRADNNQLAGRSSIRVEDAGCVVTEHWVSQATPYSGRSLNILNPATGRWEQFWVDSTGRRTLFVGGPIADGMQLTTEGPVFVQAGAPPQFSRVTLTTLPDGEVLQRGETSPDGTAWTTSYAFIYRPRSE